MAGRFRPSFFYTPVMAGLSGHLLFFWEYGSIFGPMEDILSILFGLVMVALPAVLKLVDKAKKSRPVPPGSVPGHAAPIPAAPAHATPAPAAAARVKAVPVRPAEAPKPAKSTIQGPVSPSVRRTAVPAPAPEREKAPSKNKIDKRLLVIYSEIMKPKF